MSTLHLLPRALLVAVLSAATLSACSDEDPPGWLEELAADAATTTSTSTPPPSTTTVPGQPTAAVDLEAGTCLLDPPFADGEPVEVEALRTIECDEPHDAEIFASVELPQAAGEPFPGPGLDGEARNRCLAEFEAFVGIPWTSSVLEFASLHPSESSWAEGDSSIVCSLFRGDGTELTESAEGTNT